MLCERKYPVIFANAVKAVAILFKQLAEEVGYRYNAVAFGRFRRGDNVLVPKPLIGFVYGKRFAVKSRSAGVRAISSTILSPVQNKVLNAA